MFALIENGAITQLLETVPAAPDPLPEGYVAPDYRPVVDGVKPSRTSTFSAVIPIAQDRWTIEPAQVVRGFEEVFPPMQTLRNRKREQLATGHDNLPPISVTLTLPGPVTPYGTLTFSHDSITDLLACAYVCDMEIRANAANANNLVTLIQSDLSPVQVTCSHALRIVRLFCDIHRNRHIALSAKLRAAQQAATLNDLNTIE